MKNTESILDLRPYMEVTGGFVQADVARALAIKAGKLGHEVTFQEASRAGRLIAEAKREKTIKSMRFSSRYYNFCRPLRISAHRDRPFRPIVTGHFANA